MMLPLVRSCESITLFGVPVILICLSLLALQACMLAYLHPFVWGEDLECAEEASPVLTAVCTIILCFAVVADDLADCFQTWEYLRLIPLGHGNLLFESRPSRGEQPVDLWAVKEGGVGHCHRAIVIFVYILMRAASTLSILLYGIGYIAVAQSDDDQIKDCVAFLILTDLDGMFYRIAVPNIVKADLERVPDLCLTRDSSSFTLFQRVANVFGAWLKPTLVAAFAVAMQNVYCRVEGRALAFAYPATVALGFCFYFLFSSVSGKAGHAAKLTLGDVVIGAQDPGLMPVPQEGAVLKRGDSIVNTRWRAIMCPGPSAHRQPVEDGGALRCRNCRQEIRPNTPWFWCGACQPTQSSMVCNKCRGQMSSQTAGGRRSD